MDPGFSERGRGVLGGTAQTSLGLGDLDSRGKISQHVLKEQIVNYTFLP